LLLRGALDQQIQVFKVHGLLNEVVCAFLHRGDGLFDRTVRRDQDDGNGGIGVVRFPAARPGRSNGQFEVRENEQISPGAPPSRRLPSRPAPRHFVPGAFQRLRNIARSSVLSSTQKKGSIKLCSTMFSRRAAHGDAAMCVVRYLVLEEEQP